MRQPVRKTSSVKRIKRATKQPYKRKHKEYGTSKLEQRFAKDFLDKLGIEYTYQFKAESIGRYYDFKIKDGPIIEINGSYWHGDERIYEEKDLNKIQKRAKYIDSLKEKWALEHGIPIYYIWEKDINETPSKVMEMLKEILNIANKMKNKKKRH